MNEDKIQNNETDSRSTNTSKHVLVGFLITMVAFNLFLGWRLISMQGSLDALNHTVDAKVAGLREYTMLSADMSRKSLTGMRQQVDELRTLATTEGAKARAAALKRAKILEQDLAAQQKANEERAAQIAQRLTEVQQTASARLDDISSDVSNVRTEVRTAKNDLDRTITDLRSVRGDLGFQSGLIATNSKELAALKALGARNYYEFDIAKKSKRVRVGDVQVQLKKTDTKRNKFTLELIADDKLVEKKDRTLNEPVQFYTGGSRSLCELVVNEIHSDRIVGYVSTPKMLAALR